MAEEVRNTLVHRREFTGRGDGRLRHQPVLFVSAGLMDPLKELEVKPNKDIQQPATQVQVEMDPVPQNPPTSLPSSTIAAISSRLRNDSSSQPPHQSLFVIDTVGDRSLRPPSQLSDDVVDRPEAGSDSDSSEDIILFKGRDQARHVPALSEETNVSATTNVESASLDLPELTLELEHICVVPVQRAVMEPKVLSHGSPKVVDSPARHAEPADFIPLVSSRRRSRGKQSNARPPRNDASDEEAAIIADYIANMQDEDDSEEDTGDAHPGLGTHAFSMLRDLGGSDSGAVPARITSGDDSSEISGDDDNVELDEESLRRHTEAQDAKIARLLAKQEEFGIGGDDIVLFDDADTDENEGDGWQIAPKHTPRRRKKGAASKQARIVQEKGQYPSASKMAEAFDDLDLMDWQRPSLNNFKAIGKRQQPEFDVSDSDLDEAMAIAWKKDRAKKAEKKKARELLRSQGLLGRNINPEDLRVKYRGGMSIDDMEVEFETFLIGTHEQ